MRIPPVYPARLTDLRMPEILLEVTAARVVILSRGRNAWNSSWVRHYQGETAMYTDVADAKSDAERRRGPGNVFDVTEAPALCLSGYFAHLLVVDFHPENPFGKYRGHHAKDGKSALYPGAPLTDILASFDHDSPYWAGATPSPHSIRTGMMTFDADELQPLDRERLGTWKSYAQGTRYRLGWRPMPARFSTKGIRAVLRTWRQLEEAIPGYRSRLDQMRRVMQEPRSPDREQRERRAQRAAEALNAVADLIATTND